MRWSVGDSEIAAHRAGEASAGTWARNGPRGGRPGPKRGVAKALVLGALLTLMRLGAGHPVHALSPGSVATPGDAIAHVDTLTRWFAGLRYEREFVTEDLPPWTDWALVQAILVRELPGGAVGGEVFGAERFGLRDLGLSLDLYRELWAGSYGNVRLRLTPDADVLPDRDLRLEVFQSFSGGWEISGSYWRMDFAEDDVDVAGGGLGRYMGDWYLRAVATVGTLGRRSALSMSGMVRRLVGSSKEYLEFSGGVGKEVVVLGVGPVTDVRRTRFLQARVQRFLSDRWGFSGGVAYNRFEGTPVRRAVSLGLMARY